MAVTSALHSAISSREQLRNTSCVDIRVDLAAKMNAVYVARAIFLSGQGQFLSVASGNI